MSGQRARIERGHPGAVLVLLCVAQFMVILDVSVVNVALPAIRSDLEFSRNGLQWVVSAYTITFGGLLLLGGRAGDLLGRRRMFLTGIVVFSASSLAGALAPDAVVLVAARALQGIGGAIVAPSTLALLMTTFGEGGERNRALGWWGAMASVGGSAGGIVGGVLTETLSWRWILLINVPIGIGLVAAGLRYLTGHVADPDAPPRGDFDVAGALLATAGLTAAVFGIARTSSVGWGSTQTVGVLAGAGILLAAFLRVEHRLARAPLLPLGIFRSRPLSTANALMLLLGGTMFGMWFFVSLYLQNVLGYSPIEAGLAFLPMSGLMAIAAIRVRRIVARIGARATVVLAFSCAAAGLLLFARAPADAVYPRDVLLASVILAPGIGFAMVPLTTTAVAGVPGHRAGLASGLVNVSRQIGGALGIALLASIADARTGAVVAHGGALTTALTSGYHHAFLAAAMIAILGAVASALLLPGRPAEPRSPAPVATVRRLERAAAPGAADPG